MSKTKVLVRAIEFACITAITYILAQADINDLWLILPIVIFLGMLICEYHVVSTERQLRVREQLKLLIAFLHFEPEQIVRCTYHIPIRRFPKLHEKKLRQAFDYIPAGTGVGRLFPAEKGIIGEAYSMKRALIANFRDDEDFRQQMLSKYKYSEKELGLRRADRRSYLCYSLVDEVNKVIGLIYFDSNKPETFKSLTDLPQIPDENDPLIKCILKGCETIKETLL